MMVRAQGGAGKSRCSQVSQVRAQVTEEAEEARGGAAVQAGFPNPKGQCGAFPQGAWGEGVVNRPGLGHSLAGAGSAQPGRYLVGEKPAVPAEAPLLPPPGSLQPGPQGARSLPREHPWRDWGDCVLSPRTHRWSCHRASV